MATSSIEMLERALGEIPLQDEQARADALIELAMGLRAEEQWDRMLALVAEALECSERIGYTRGIANAVIARSFVEYIHSEYSSAVKGCMHALELCSDDDGLVSRARGVLALVHWSLGNFDEAMRNGSFATEVYRRTGDHMNEAFAYVTRGGIMQSVGKFAEALEANEQGLEAFRSLNHVIGEARALTGMAAAYLALGRSADALAAANESLRLARTTGNALGTSRALNDLGEIHASAGDFDSALACHTEALELRRRERYRQAEGTSLLNIGRIHLARGYVDLALATLHEGLTIVQQIGALPKERDFHHVLAGAYEKLSRFEDALRHAKAYSDAKSRISAEQETARLRAIELEGQLVWAQKDAEIQRLRNVELKNAMDELQAAQAELVNSTMLAGLGSLVAAVAHEINNPLGVIRSSADVAQRCARKLGPGELPEILDKNSTAIVSASDRIAGVIRRLKSFAGIDRAALAHVSIPDLIDDVLALLEPEYRGRVQIRTEYGEVPRISAYATEIGQVIMNVVRNAIQAIDGSGVVTVRVQAIDGSIVVSISDTGRGIPQERMEHLFEASFNSREARVKASLSLFASASIMRRHGGSLEASSRVGEGSVFTMTLPLVSAAKAG